MDNVKYEIIVNSINKSILPSQVEATLNWIDNFEINEGKEAADKLRKLAYNKLTTFEL